MSGAYGFGNILSILMPISAIVAVLATVFFGILFIGVNKEKRWENSRFGSFLYDTINFKSLLIDKIMKVLYIFLNCFCIMAGVILFFFGIYFVIAEGSWAPLGISLLMIIVGPIALRIVYEVLMMGIMLVQNVVEINRKMNH